MTNKKRFERIYEDVDVFCRDHNAKGISQLIEKEDYDKIVDLLNELADENEQLKDALNQRTDQCDKYYKENEQLKQRNDRQAKRLAELYELMAKKDWDSLTEIIDDFCSCEEQLQRESGTYSDWND